MVQIITHVFEELRPRRKANDPMVEERLVQDREALVKLEIWASGRRHMLERNIEPLDEPTRRRAKAAVAVLFGNPGLK